MKLQKSRHRGLFRLVGLCLMLVLLSLAWLGCSPEPRKKSDGNNTTDGGVVTDTTVDKTPPPDRKVPPNSCAAIMNCAKTKCASNATPDCLESCATDVAEPGKGQWNALKTCWTGKCVPACAGKGSTCLNACLTSKCLTPLTNCGAGSAGATCKDSVACLNKCGVGNVWCIADCVSGSKTTVRNALTQRVLCLSTDAPDKPDATACNKAEVDCDCPGLVAGSGAGVCQSLENCRKGCSGNRCCLAKCDADASQQAIQLQDSLNVCRQQGGGGTPAQKQKCADDHVSCYCPANVPGKGTKACSEYTTCLGTCKAGDICCTAGCRASLKPTVISQADSFLTCYLNKCANSCKPGDKNCIDLCTIEQCGKETVGCVCPGTPAPGTGSKKCSAGTDCLKKCQPNDDCCFARCGGQLRASSFKKLMDLVKCLATCGCADGDAKCSEKCATSGKCRSKGFACGFD